MSNKEVPDYTLVDTPRLQLPEWQRIIRQDENDQLTSQTTQASEIKKKEEAA